MNRLGDAPTDLLFGLIALQNDLIAPEAISAALQAQALETGRTLGDLLVTQGNLTQAQRDLVETLSGEYIGRHGGDPEKSLCTLINSPSARARLDQLGDLGATESLTAAASLTSTLPYGADPQVDDPDRTLLPPANIVLNSWPRVAGYEIVQILGAGGMGIVYKARPAAAGPVRRPEDDSRRRRRST